MSFVPVGFWQRFIARMLISLAEMDLQVAWFLKGEGMGVEELLKAHCWGKATSSVLVRPD